MATYGRIMDAQRRIASARARAGVTGDEIDRALEACEPPAAAALTDEQLYDQTLERFVAALGGRVESSAAVFAEETIALPRPEG